MSLLLDALKKAAEQKAKKSKQEAAGTPVADEAGDDDDSSIEALLARGSESTDTNIGRPELLVDEDELSISVNEGDANDVRNPASLARSMRSDDTEIRQPTDFAETLVDDQSDSTEAGEFAETMVVEDRDGFGETGGFARTMIDEDRSQFADTGQFAETLIDEDRTDLTDDSRFAETLVSTDGSELTDTGRFAETMLDEDRTEFSEAPLDDGTDFSETTQYVDLPDEDPAEFAETREEDRTELGVSTEFGESGVEDRSESRESTEFGDTRIEDRTESPESTEFGDTRIEDRSESPESTEFGDTRIEDRTETRESTEIGSGEGTGVTAETTEYTVHFEDEDSGFDLDKEDSTEYSGSGLTDVTGFDSADGDSEDAVHIATQLPEDQTDTRTPMSTLSDLARRENDDTTNVNEDDMSLLLVEDPTDMAERSLTDPRGRGDALRALQDDQPSALSLVDTTRHQVPVDRAPGVESGSATITSGLDTQTRGGEGTTRRAEQTFTAASTTTYAPDNYDRTLMRLPSDDQSKLFAGMKPEGDVVMTPDYAKKVFRSKSTAQRWQHLRTYAAIAIIILIGIGFYGALEYQEQSESIDTSLRPLKRDPMPGLIRPETSQSLAGLFADPEITERTIDIIQSADRPDDGSIAGAVEIGAETAETGVNADTAAEQVARPSSADAVSGAAVAAPTRVASVNATGQSVTPVKSASRPTPSNNSTLQITSNKRLAERDVWLRQAYAAYQAGNDAEASRLYSQVLAQDPANRNALLGRAAINVQNNNAGLALRDYQRLLEANPKDSLAMTSMLAISNLSPVETESQLKLMIRDEPDSPYLNFALANAYGAQRRWREAQGHYFIALENNPRDPNYAYNLAVSLEHIAQPGAAVSYYRRALDNFDNGLATFSRELVNQRVQVLENL